MKKKGLLILATMLFIISASICMALSETDETSSQPLEKEEEAVTKLAAGGAKIAIIETLLDVENSVNKAVGELGYSYDFFDGTFPADYSVYDIIIQAMDGGTTHQIPQFATFINNGGCGILIGGSNHRPFADDVHANLMAIVYDNHAWTKVAGTPDITIVDAAHCLAAGLPSTYDFTDDGATYYMLRITDTGVHVVAENGDGYKAIVQKDIGDGSFICFINSPNDSYWTNAGDYNYLKTFIKNALECCYPEPVGGAYTPVNKLVLVAPWAVLCSITTTIVIAAVVFKRRKP